MPKKEVNVKLVAVGDKGVGKTCLYTRHAKGTFPTDYIPTVFDGWVSTVEKSDKTLHVALWDTAAGKEYDRLRPLSYPDTSFLALLFAIDDRESFHNVKSKWKLELERYCPNVPIALVGSKSDLRSDIAGNPHPSSETHLVTSAEGQKMAEEIMAVKYFECSALTGFGVEELFQYFHDYVFVSSRKHKNRTGFIDCKII